MIPGCHTPLRNRICDIVGLRPSEDMPKTNANTMPDITAMTRLLSWFEKMTFSNLKRVTMSGRCFAIFLEPWVAFGSTAAKPKPARFGFFDHRPEAFRSHVIIVSPDGKNVNHITIT